LMVLSFGKLMMVKTKFKVGDFVACQYDFYEFGSIVYDGENRFVNPFYGIILLVDAQPEAIFGYDVLYQVVCLDGNLRFFTEWEITLV